MAPSPRHYEVTRRGARGLAFSDGVDHADTRGIERRTGQIPETLLADGGHLQFDCLASYEPGASSDPFDGKSRLGLGPCRCAA